jgi:hypothetical protein
MENIGINVGHTPGPWVILRHRKRVYIQGRNNSAYFSIAEVSGPSNPDVNSLNQLTANIKLIVAAPELLKELHRVLPYITNDEERVRILEVIAKAESK